MKKYEENMNCPKCGQELKEDAKFCKGCGLRREVAPGRRLLKITGIIALILSVGGIGMQGWLFMLRFAPDVFPKEMSQAVAQAMSTPTPILVYGMILVWYSFFVAIMAIVHCRNLAKASFLGWLGLLWIGMQVGSLFVSYYYAGAELAMAGLPWLPLNLILPILYIVGAIKNDKAASLQD